MENRMSTVYAYVGDVNSPDNIVVPDAAPLTEKLEASRRALAAKQAQEAAMTAALGRIVVDGEAADVDAARAARSQVRQDIGDLAAAIHELETQVAQAYDREQRAHADQAITAAEQFDVSLALLLKAMKDVDAAGRAMYETANKHRDPRARALLGLVWSTGETVDGYMLETLKGLPQQRAPWAAPQPSLVDAARSRANVVDWET
jgi:hypothetical protein